MKRIILFSLWMMYGLANAQNCTFPGQDSLWQSGHAMPGLETNTVFAILSKSDGVYVLPQQEYTQELSFGGIPAANAGRIGRWDGNNWTLFGGFFNPSTYTIYAAAWDADSNWVIGGDFSSVYDSAGAGSPLQVNNLVRWNFAQKRFEAFGNGLNGVVQSIICLGDTVYVAGTFTTASNSNGTITVNHVARYVPGMGWEAMDNGVSIGYGIPLRLSKGLNNEVFVSGDITYANGKIASGVVSWKNGIGWNVLNGGPKINYDTTQNNGVLYASKIRGLVYDPIDSALYVQGELGHYFGQLKGFAKYKDSAWRYLPFGSSSGGGFNVSYAMEWEPVSRRIYVAGAFNISQNSTSVGNFIAAYSVDSLYWSTMDNGLVAAARSVCFWRNEVYVGGNFEYSKSDSVRVDKLARYSQGKWKTVGGGIHGRSSIVYAAESWGDTLIIGGEFDFVNGQKANGLAMYHKSTGWKPILGLTSNSSSNDLVSVRSLKRLGDTLYVGGTFAGFTGTNSFGLAAYTLSSKTWSIVGGSGLNASASSRINCIDTFQNQLVVAGYFSSVNGVNATNLAKYNGSTWTAGASMGGEIIDMARMRDTALIFVGPFSFGNGFNFVGQICSWSGSAILNPIKFGFTTGTVNCVEVDPKSHAIYVGGQGLSTRYGGSSSNTSIGSFVVCDTGWHTAAVLNSYSGQTANVNALYVDTTFTTMVYAAGSKMQLYNQNGYHVFRYAPGGGISGFGSGIHAGSTDAFPEVIYPNGGQLFVGGQFGIAGKKASMAIASYALEDLSDLSIQVDLGPNDSAFSTYLVEAQIVGNAVGVYWSNGEQSIRQIKLYESDTLSIQVINGIGCEVRDTIIVKVLGSELFQGGIGDGYSDDTAFQATSYMLGSSGSGSNAGSYLDSSLIYLGGLGDGMGAGLVEQDSNFFYGGSGDGHASALSLDSSLFYTGGNGSGGDEENMQKQISFYLGGKADGHAAIELYRIPDLAAISIPGIPAVIVVNDSIPLYFEVSNLGNRSVDSFQIRWGIDGVWTDSMVVDTLLYAGNAIQIYSKRYHKRTDSKTYTLCFEIGILDRETSINNNRFCTTISTINALAKYEGNRVNYLIYPNPSKHWLSIDRLGNLNEAAELSVYGVDGKMIREEQFKADQVNLNLDISTLLPGVYLIHIKSPSGTWNSKFIRIE